MIKRRMGKLSYPGVVFYLYAWLGITCLESIWSLILYFFFSVVRRVCLCLHRTALSIVLRTKKNFRPMQKNQNDVGSVSQVLFLVVISRI